MNVDLAPEMLLELVTMSLDEGKAQDVRILDVRGMTSITDYMVVASGRSARGVKALKDLVLKAAREQQVRPLGVEGETVGEWVLIDFGDVIVHTMRPETRDFYQLEKLWDPATAEPDLAERTLDS
ncbi:MAG: ribosome silencing factor [Gammaproteobacteria bacterium]